MTKDSFEEFIGQAVPTGAYLVYAENLKTAKKKKGLNITTQKDILKN